MFPENAAEAESLITEELVRSRRALLFLEEVPWLKESSPRCRRDREVERRGVFSRWLFAAD